MRERGFATMVARMEELCACGCELLGMGSRIQSDFWVASGKMKHPA